MIPFNRPTTHPNGTKYVQNVLNGQHLCGDGEYTKKCSELLESILGSKVLMTTSCTHALELAALLMPEDVSNAVMSTFTFSSTANAFLMCGIAPRLVDIDPLTLNLDAKDALAAADEHSVLVPMHYAGVGCDMEHLDGVGLPVIEDNAQGLFGKYQGQYLGTFGELAALSFHETKNFTCGEGGALIINDPTLIKRAEIIREKGTNRTQFKRGKIDKYTWVDVGSSYLPSEILMAYLYAQLEDWQMIQLKRQVVWNHYEASLCGWANEYGTFVPHVPIGCQQSYHMFYLLMLSQQDRDGLIKHLAQREIMATFHYIPLHLSPMGQKLGYRAGQFPIAEDLAGRLVRLPFYTDMTVEEQDRVIEAVKEFRCQ